MFIAVEGINGSGKDTLINKLKDISLSNPERLVYSGYNLEMLRVFTAKPREDELALIKGYNYSNLSEEDRLKYANEICSIFINNYVRIKPGRNTKDEKEKYTYAIELANRWNLSNLIYGLITAYGNELSSSINHSCDVLGAINKQNVREFINKRLDDYLTNRFLLPNKIIYVSTDPDIAINRLLQREDGRTSSSYHMKEDVIVSSYLYDEFIDGLKDPQFAYHFITPLEVYTSWGDSEASSVFTFNGNLDVGSSEYEEQFNYLLDFLRR